MAKTSYLLTYRTAPNENKAIAEKIGFNEAWAFADNNARYNKLFHLISIVDKSNGAVIYRG